MFCRRARWGAAIVSRSPSRGKSGGVALAESGELQMSISVWSMKLAIIAGCTVVSVWD